MKMGVKMNKLCFIEYDLKVTELRARRGLKARKKGAKKQTRARGLPKSEEVKLLGWGEVDKILKKNCRS